MPEAPAQPPLTRHDRIFKEFFHRFLPQFIRLFFPEEARHLKFDGLRFLDKELVINLPGQTLRITDVVVEVETVTGETETILIHIEIEANPQTNFPQRMFEYYALLRVLRQQPVLPIALVLRRGSGGLHWQKYKETLVGRRILAFRYGQVGIRDLEGEEYMLHNDPVSSALASLMDVSDERRPILKLSALRNVIASDLTEGDKLFLMKLIETYLPTAELTNAEDTVIEQLADIELSHYERMELEFTRKGIEEGLEEGMAKGIEKGMEKGREEGELSGKRSLLLNLLTHRFGTLPQEIVARIGRIMDHNLLDPIVEQALTAQSVADLTFPMTTGDAPNGRKD